MKLTDLPQEFIDASPVLEIIHQAGFEAYFVGGSVRDVLLHQQIHDVDIATSAFPEEIKQLFHRTIDIGIEHGTVLVLHREESYEITTFRTESSYQDFRRPDSVEFVRSLEEDLKRRDFTMNALALASNGEIIDLFSGVEDIQKRMIRAVGNASERFHEDALRMMRGLRFVSQLDFDMDGETYEAIKENSHLLKQISVERIEIEWMKLLTGISRNRALSLFIDSQCYKYCPSLADYEQRLREMTDLPEFQLTDEIQAWTVVVDQLTIGEKEVGRFLKEWKTSNECIRKVQKAYKGLLIRKKRQWDAWTVYQLGEDAVKIVERILPFYHIESNEASAMSIFQNLPIYSLQDLEINGNDLLIQTNKKPGKWVRNTLIHLEEQVVLGNLENNSSQLIAQAEIFLMNYSEN